MKQCSQCNFENIRNSFYCERCGTLLPSSYAAQSTKTTYTPHSQDYTVPMLEMYTPTPPPPPPPPPASMVHNFVYSTEQLTEQPRPSHTGGLLYTIGRITVYLLGTITASLGLFGFLTAFMSDTAAIVGFLFLFMSSIIMLVMVLLLHHKPYLRWWQRLLGILAATGGVFVALLFGAVIIGSAPSNSAKADIVYGSIVMIYGIVLAGIALW